LPEEIQHPVSTTQHLNESRTNTSRHVKQNPSSNVDKKRMGEDALTDEKMATEGDEHIADAVTTDVIAADLPCITAAVGRGSAATTAGPSPAAVAARRTPPACVSPPPTSCTRGDQPLPSVGFAVGRWEKGSLAGRWRRVHQREKGGRREGGVTDGRATGAAGHLRAPVLPSRKTTTRPTGFFPRERRRVFVPGPA
jgi:hypothetical protein